jgi:hypothetical protein
MKRSIYLAVGILFSSLFYSCELLPDLNPNTSEGANILVRVENRLVARPELVSLNPNVVHYALESFDLDITNDGINDISFEITGGTIPGLVGNYEIQFSNGQFLINSIFYTLACPNDQCSSILGLPPLYQSNTSSGPALGVWKENVSDADIGSGFPWSPIRSSFFFSQFDIPNGIKYVMFKQFINNNVHYGWLEFQNNINRNTGTGQCILKRVALAQQPGYVLRAGQTE